jgi:hypothetical protein
MSFSERGIDEVHWLERRFGWRLCLTAEAA